MKKNSFILTLFSFIFPFILFSQSKWTLEQCIDYALENNLSLQQAEGEQTKIKIKDKALRESYLPKADIILAEHFNFGRSLNRDNTYDNVNSNNANVEFRAEMPLFDALQTYYSLKENKENLKNIKQIKYAKELQLKLDLAQSFYSLIISKQFYEIALEQKETTLQQLIKTEERIKARIISKSHLFELKAQLAEDKLNIVEKRADLAIALIELKQLMNLDENENFDVYLPETSMQEKRIRANALAELNNSAVLNFPHLKAEEYKLQQLNYTEKKIKSSYLPTLSLGSGVGSSYFYRSGVENMGFKNQLQNNYQSNIYLSFRLPLLNHFSIRRNLQTIKIEQKNQNLVIREAKQKIDKQLSKILLELDNAEEKLKAYQILAEANREAHNSASEQYNAGKLSIYDLRLSKQKLLNSRSQELQAKYNLIYKTFVLNLFYSL